MATVRTRHRLRTSLQAAEAELISRSPKSSDRSWATARWWQAHSWEGTGSTCPCPLQPRAAAPHRLHTACSACEPTCLCLPLQGRLRVRPAGSATPTLLRGGDGTAQHLPSLAVTVSVGGTERGPDQPRPSSNPSSDRAGFWGFWGWSGEPNSKEWGLGGQGAGAGRGKW